MSDYLPTGSENDPNAPWNQAEDLCRYCDVDVIKEMAIALADDGHKDVEDIEQHLLDNSDLCKDCYKEQEADDIDDWINWRD